MLTRCEKYVLLSILFISGCAILPKFPQIAEVESLRIEENNDVMLKIKVDSKIYNPNRFSFRVDEMKYWAYVDFLYLGGGRIIGPIWFYNQDTTDLINQPVYIVYQNFEEILDNYQQLDSIPVTFFIKAHLNLSPILPVYYIKTLWLKPADFIKAAINPYNIEKLISIKNVEIENLDLFKSIVKGQIILKNDFPLSYTIDSLCLRVYDRFNQNVGQIRICNKKVNKFTHQSLPFELYVDNIMAAVSIMGQYIEEDISYTSIGYLYLTIKEDKFKIPIHESIGLTIDRDVN